MGLKIIEGRDFATELRTDAGVSWLVNEAFVRKMGWTEPLGKHIRVERLDGRVIGVMADFNCKSLHTLVEPVLAFQSPDDFTRVPEVLLPFQQSKLVVKIAGTLSQRILVLVLMGSVLAVVISYFAIDEWLTGSPTVPESIRCYSCCRPSSPQSWHSPQWRCSRTGPRAPIGRGFASGMGGLARGLSLTSP